MRSGHAAEHPRLSRRAAVQAGAVGLLGLGTNHLQALRALAADKGGAASAAHGDSQQSKGRLVSNARSVIYIFLSGGLSQLESFDLKPEAPADMRGEFRPIATKTPGIEICEYLPQLAQRSHLWALVRSLTHGSNDHSAGHHIMLTGGRTFRRGLIRMRLGPATGPRSPPSPGPSPRHATTCRPRSCCPKP